MDLLTTKFSLGKSSKSPNNAQVHFFSSKSTDDFEKLLYYYRAEKSSHIHGVISNALSIGLFDSGIGGLGIVQVLEPLFPNGEIFYFADQAHFPYGEKSPSQILKYSRDIAHFLLEKGAELLIIACHTASAYALSELKKELPIPVLGMIEPTTSLLKDVKKVVLLGSNALIRSSIYQNRIQKENSGIQIITTICQELISMVEEMHIENFRTFAQNLLPKEPFDAVLLSCTHFTLIKTLFQEVVGPHIRILDPAERIAVGVISKIFNPNYFSMN